MYVAVVEYAHPYSRCGYGADLYDRTRKGEVSSDGECRNRSGITCVLSQDSWVCPDSLKDLNADRDYFIGSIIAHEFLHPFGIDAADLNQDHFASTSCIKRGGVTAAQADAVMNDVWEAQVNLGFCPDVFARFRR